VRESQNELRAARERPPQLISYRVTTTPASRLSRSPTTGDPCRAFGCAAHEALEVIAEAAVETRRTPLFTASPHVDSVRGEQFREEHLEYLLPTPPRIGAGVAEEASRDRGRGPGPREHRAALHRRVGSSMSYEPGSTTSVSRSRRCSLGVGVCQDLRTLRSRCAAASACPPGMCRATCSPRTARPARTLTPRQCGCRPTWFEAAIPGGGWLALDPTNATEVGLRHVKIGHGRDYNDVPPLRGVWRGSAEPRRHRGHPPSRRREPRTRRAAAAAQQRLDEARARAARSAVGPAAQQ
jgi:hypothetical protein